MMGTVRQRHVEAPPARPTEKLREPRGHRGELPRCGATVAPEYGRLQSVESQELDRLAELPRRDLDFVAALSEDLDERAEDEDVRWRRDVDPHPHERGV
jgi:hypothetical protein